MHIIYGEKPYGQCDVVPELFYVATWFYHLDYLPLAPIGSKLVLSQSGDHYVTIDIPFSYKSLFYAWSRTATFLASVIASVTLLFTMLDHRAAVDIGFTTPICCALISTALLLFLMNYPRKKKPSFRRALQLAQYCQLNEKGMAALYLLYDRDPLTGQPNSPTDTLSVR